MFVVAAVASPNSCFGLRALSEELAEPKEELLLPKACFYELAAPKALISGTKLFSSCFKEFFLPELLCEGGFSLLLFLEADLP